MDNKNKRLRSMSSGAASVLLKPRLLDLGEDDDQGKQSEGLDEREPEDQQKLDAGARARVASECFGGRSSGAALAEAAETGREGHTDAGADGHQVHRGR